MRHPPPAVTGPFSPGIDVFLEEPERWLRGPRVALLANMASLTGIWATTLGALRAAPAVDLRALLTPEHGWSGFDEDAVPVGDQQEARTGLALHSLYGPRRRPAPEALAEVDAVVVDLQEVGVRCYTYAATVVLLLEAAAESGTRVVLADRPNLLGNRVDGPELDAAHRSFLGYLATPYQHALTLGELAAWYSRHHLRGQVDLRVVPMRGWRRGSLPPGPWVPPSPGLPTLDAVRLYPGTVLLEGLNLSEGRGTTLPFQLLGAPWLEAYSLAGALEDLALPGLRFRPLVFRPESGKYRGEVCQGVQFLITDPAALRPLPALVAVLRRVRDAFPGLEAVDCASLPWSREPGAGQPWHEPVAGPLLDGLTGGTGIREAIFGGCEPDDLLPAWRQAGRSFVAEVRKDLIYGDIPVVAD